jgi:3-dehydroquinate dehydratase-2
MISTSFTLAQPEALMRVAVLNGPNLNLLGTREPELYGRQTLADIEASVRAEAARLDVEIEWFQTNHEGDLVEAVQGLRGRVDGVVINPPPTVT